jgi:hypothetical protein
MIKKNKKTTLYKIKKQKLKKISIYNKITLQTKTQKKFFLKSIKFKKRKKKNSRKNLDGTLIFKYTINILVKQHNVFCILTTTKENKALHVCSSGKYKIKMSKKKIIHTYYWYLRKFFGIIKKLIRIPSIKKLSDKKLKVNKRAGIIVKLISSRQISENIINTTRYILKKRPYFLLVSDKKIFNGCRPPKKVRKRKRRMRNFK